MTSNYWTADASRLAEAYTRNPGTIRFELITRCLLSILGDAPKRVVDVGGGYGLQAILLARAGHEVLIVDIDPRMLNHARELAAGEPPEVVRRLSFVLGDGKEGAGSESAIASLEGHFDLVCCHSVIMYEDDPRPMIERLVALSRPGGLLSVLSVNPDASAMRSGLQGRWRDVVATLQAGEQMDAQYAKCREHRREDIVRFMEAAGAETLGWQGIGIFTDHLTDPLVVEDAAPVFLAEWIAGNRDPYRQVARCYHLLAKASGVTG